MDAVRQILPYLIPKLNPKIQQAMELKDTMYSQHAKGQAREINHLGARTNFLLRVNGNYGNQLDASYFREGGSHNTKQAIIGFTQDSITHQVSGQYFTGVKDPNVIGGKIADLMKYNVLYMKKQRDIDFCHGDGTGTRGTISSISSTDTIVFTAEEGHRFIDIGEYYFIHAATAPYAQHGAAAGHLVTAKNADGVTITVTNDITSNTTAAATDIVVHKGTADNVSSINKALYGYEFLFNDSGPYFGLDRTTEILLHGLKINAGSKPISFTLLEKGQTKWFYRWNEPAPDNLCNAIPPCLEAEYKLLMYGLRRVNSNSAVETFDGSVKKITDGGYTTYIDANIRPTNWFRYDPATIERYEFRPTGIWDLDGLQMRAPQGNSSIQNSVFWIIWGAEQMFCNQPGRAIWYNTVSTTGFETGIGTT